MSKQYLLQAFVETPWAILPAKLETLAEIVARHANGEQLDAEEVQSRIHGAARPPDRRVQSVAVLPLFGTIFPKANLMTKMSGATSAQIFGAEFSKLLNDPAIDAIVLEVDSPGGQVGGIDEVSNLIYEARGKKPVIAVANYLMASAAYWIGSAAEELVVSPSAEVGSIGVFAVHQDVSGALEQAGVKVSIISEGKYKTVGNPYQPLGEEARAVIQASVRETYEAFVRSVARNRAMDTETVMNGFGEGGLVSAARAVEMGMADRVATLDETIDRLLNGPRSAVRGQPSAVSDVQNAEIGQAPDSDTKPTQEARARLVRVGHKEISGGTTMLRKLQRDREELVAKAQALVDTADAEERDLTEAERAEFVQLLGEGESTGEVGALDAQIEQISQERERLRAAAEKKFTPGASQSTEPVKPDGQADAKRIKRAEFDALDADERAAFVKRGVKLED